MDAGNQERVDYHAMLITEKYNVYPAFWCDVIDRSFLCCVVRMALPLEFTEHQYIIDDYFFYALIMDPYISSGSPEWILEVLLFAWMLGSIILLFHFIRRLKYAQDFLKKCEFEEYESDRKILSGIDASGKLQVKRADIDVPMLTGFLKPTIYLPIVDYSDEQLYYIVLHEYTHWKNRDIWVKLLVNLFCIIFWWNPFVYFLRKDLARILELKCDYTLTRLMKEAEKMHYTETLLFVLKNGGDKNKKLADGLCTVEFIDSSQGSATKQRFEFLLTKEPGKFIQVVCKSGCLLLVVLLMYSSYYFIWQPAYEAPEDELWEDGTSFVADEENAYLVKEKDGDYTFYWDGLGTDVPTEDVEAGLYDIYPIYDNNDVKERVNYENQTQKSIFDIIRIFFNSWLYISER